MFQCFAHFLLFISVCCLCRQAGWPTIGRWRTGPRKEGCALTTTRSVTDLDWIWCSMGSPVTLKALRRSVFWDAVMQRIPLSRSWCWDIYCTPSPVSKRSDWHCWPHWSWKIKPDQLLVSHHWGGRRSHPHWRYRYFHHWSAWPQKQAHDHSTGAVHREKKQQQQVVFHSHGFYSEHHFLSCRTPFCSLGLWGWTSILLMRLATQISGGCWSSPTWRSTSPDCSRGCNMKSQREEKTSGLHWCWILAALVEKQLRSGSELILSSVFKSLDYDHS